MSGGVRLKRLYKPESTENIKVDDVEQIGKEELERENSRSNEKSFSGKCNNNHRKGDTPPSPPVAGRKYRFHLSSPTEVRKCLSSVVNGMLNGEIEPAIGRTVAYACQVILSTLELALMQNEIKELQEYARNQRRGSG